MKKCKFQKIKFLMMWQIRVPKIWNYIAHALRGGGERRIEPPKKSIGHPKRRKKCAFKI